MTKLWNKRLLPCLFLILCGIVNSVIQISLDEDFFQGDTVHESRTRGNLTVVSYGYRDKASGAPAWARKALHGRVPFDALSCSVEALAIHVGPRIGQFPRRIGSLYLISQGSVDIPRSIDVPMKLLHGAAHDAAADCVSASPYGHSYTIKDSVVPRTMSILCYVKESEAAAKETCSKLNTPSSDTYFIISFPASKDASKSLHAVFKPKISPHPILPPPLQHAFPDTMIGCVVPMNTLNSNGAAKLHLWIEYHIQLGLAVALATESITNIASIPPRLLNHPHIVIYAPGMLSAIGFYRHVENVRRGKFRPHFDTDKTVTTTFIRFENRIYRGIKAYVSVDADEFLFAPSAPLSEDLGIFRFDSDWANRCRTIRSLPLNSSLWSQAARYNRSLGLAIGDNPSDPLYQVHRPQLALASSVDAHSTIRWSPKELQALKQMGAYIRDRISEYMCISDEYGMQVDIPRADVAHEMHSESCIRDNLDRGVYSLSPCMEFMGVLQEGSTAKRAYKNKHIIIGQVSYIEL